MRILIIEDDIQTANFVRQGLLDEGHSVDVARNGPEGLKLSVVNPYDVLVVDRMLPGLDGLSIVQELRRAEVNSSVLFMTSLGGIEDRVEGLENGGDDYLVKPFALAELKARVNALGRRPAMKSEETVLRVADLELHLIRREVIRAGQIIDLQPREFKLLEVLMRNKGRVLTRSMLLEQVWDFHFDPKTSIVETHISRLRAKVDRAFDKPLIRTLRGAGYAINDSA
jgi:two-component system OmpR family response regulator